jgi:glutamine amidotransferase
MNIGILDYKACNLSSIYYSVYRMGYDPIIVSKAEEIKQVDKLIIPGVGSAKHCLDHLKRTGLFDEINEFLNLEKPILGICLGLQIFCKNLYEHGYSQGFGLFDAKVIPISNNNYFNIGWSKIKYYNSNSLPLEILNNNIFYFCHSHYINFENEKDKKNCLGYLNNEIKIPSILKKKNFIGVQFHPEKSQRNGENIIGYFLNS